MTRGLVILGLAIVTLLTGGVIGVFVLTRVEHGKWQMPTRDDFVRVKDRLTGAPPRPSRTIYLARGAMTIVPGEDDAAAGRSSVVASQGDLARALPGWRGTDKAWNATVACVRELFAPFDVVVTDERPADDDFLLVAVGGRPRDIGVKENSITGLAPFNGAVIPRAVVFAFAAQLGHQPRSVCETVAMEVAHAYGLDHEYLCSDVMSYLKPCGKRGFVDKTVPCGEAKKRPCAGGATTQNSYQRLRAVLGPRE